MSDTHRTHDRYAVEAISPGCQWEEAVNYWVIDTNTDGIYSRHFTRTAALAACSRLNGRDMTPEYTEEEN